MSNSTYCAEGKRLFWCPSCCKSYYDNPGHKGKLCFTCNKKKERRERIEQTTLDTKISAREFIEFISDKMSEPFIRRMETCDLEDTSTRVWMDLYIKFMEIRK